MRRTLSPQAQEILAALEQEAMARRSDAQPGGQPVAVAAPSQEHAFAPDLPALIDAILTQAQRSHQRLAALAEEVAEFAGRLDVPGGGSGPLAVPSARPAPAEAPPAEGERRLSRRAARRLAVDMAAAGASRHTIDDRLRSLHGITDPTPTLDLVFGVETTGEDAGGPGPGAALDPSEGPEVEESDPAPREPSAATEPLAEEEPAAVEEEPAAAQADERRPSGSSALRLAGDLAAAGESRGSVGEWLRSLYGIPDPTSTLDSVFGVGTADEDRSALHHKAAPDGPGASRPVTPDERLAAEPVTMRSSAVTEKPAAEEHETGASRIERPPALEVIDLHHHLLPGIDDGPPTLDDTLALARAAVAAGTTTVVATPHVSRRHLANTAARIAEEVAALEEVLAAASIPLRVLAGAEVAVTHAADLSDKELTALSLGDGPYLLVECPLTPTADGPELLLMALLERGHRILLAHPERCHAFQRDGEMLARLVSRGVLAQITASSLTGDFGRTVREVAHRFVRDGLVHVVASDAHSVDRRPPSLLFPLEQEGYAEQAAWLVDRIPRAILEGGPVPVMPAAPPLPRAGLKRLLGR